MTTETLVKARSGEAGFTLVELAIVLVIIGLLIGGVLKGQELINNAQISATQQGIQSITSATALFKRDMGGALPGDFNTPAVSLPRCGAAPCNLAGNGDGIIGVGPGNAASDTGENLAFWAHLAARDLIKGVNTNGAAAWGDGLPSMPVGGGLRVGYAATAATLDASVPGATPRAGHYLALMTSPTAAMAAATATFSAGQIATLDRKLDDGRTITGSVIAAGAAACSIAGGANAGMYNEAVETGQCGAYIRMD